MRFDPGPGHGGHCIPIDPFYLTWKAREYDFSTRFIELAGEVNQNMPYYCRSRVSQALNHGAGKSVKGSRILVLGVAYKADISDMRESPAVKLIELLQNAGADVSYHDPHVPSFEEHGATLTSVALEPAAYDAVVIATAHTGIDYAQLVVDANLVVDLRNAVGRQGISSDNVWKLCSGSGRPAWACGARTSCGTSPRCPISPGCATTASRRSQNSPPDTRAPAPP